MLFLGMRARSRISHLELEYQGESNNQIALATDCHVLRIGTKSEVQFSPKIWVRGKYNMASLTFAESWRSSFEGQCGGGLGSKFGLIGLAKPGGHARLP